MGSSWATSLSVAGVIKAGLCGKGVGFEPLEQRHVEATANIHILGCVVVGVNQSWKYPPNLSKGLNLGLAQQQVPGTRKPPRGNSTNLMLLLKLCLSNSAPHHGGLFALNAQPSYQSLIQKETHMDLRSRRASSLGCKKATRPALFTPSHACGSTCSVAESREWITVPRNTLSTSSSILHFFSLVCSFFSIF